MRAAAPSLSVLDPWIAARIGAAPPLTREAIEAWQLARLRELFRRVRKMSPLYARRLREVPDPQRLEDIGRLPCTTAEDLRSRHQDMLCVSQDQVARIVSLASSGTTGPPKRLFYSDADLELTMDFFHHGMAELVRPGQRVLILLPGDTPDSTGDLLARALARMDVTAQVHGLVRAPEAALEQAVAFDAHCLVGFPVQLLAMARQYEAVPARHWKPANLLLCSDYIASSVARELVRIWGCAVHSHYGTVETGLGGGVECSARAGVHLREADLLFEILDPETAAPLPEGAWGEIVVSTLTRQAMPLVRYRTGDLGRLLPGRCACGSLVRRLDQVQGRLENRLQLADGSHLAMGRLDELLLDIPGVIDFQAAAKPQNDGPPRLRLKLLAMPGFEAAAGKVAGKRLLREFGMAAARRTAMVELETTAWSPAAAAPAKRTLVIENQRKQAQ